MGGRGGNVERDVFWDPKPGDILRCGFALKNVKKLVPGGLLVLSCSLGGWCTSFYTFGEWGDLEFVWEVVARGR